MRELLQRVVSDEELEAKKKDTTWEDIKRTELATTEESPDASREEVERLKRELSDLVEERKTLTRESLLQRRQSTDQDLVKQLALFDKQLAEGPPFSQENCDSTSSFVRCLPSLSLDPQAPRYSFGGEHFYSFDTHSVAYPVTELETFVGDAKEIRSWPSSFECAEGKALPSGSVKLR